MSAAPAFFIAMALAIVAMFAFVVGRARGQADVRNEIAKDTAQAEKDRDKIEEDISKRPDEQVDKDLDKWHRD